MRRLSEGLMWTGFGLYVLAQLAVLSQALSAWGTGGILVLLLGPVGIIMLALVTGMTGPMLVLVLAGGCWWVSDWVTKRARAAR